MIGQHVITLAILAAVTIWARADLSVDQAIQILLDPYAASPLKLDACNALRDYRGPDMRWVVHALARQSRYDMAPVRERALEVLESVVGEKEAARLRDPLQLNQALNPMERLNSTSTWLASIHDWNDFSDVRAALKSDIPYAQDAAVRGALKIWAARRALPTDRNRAGIVEVEDKLFEVFYDVFPKLSAGERACALEFGIALDVNNPRLLPLFIEALCDDDDRVKALAQTAADRFTVSTDHVDHGVIGQLVKMAIRQKEAPKPAGLAQKYINAMGAESQAMAVRWALYYLATGDGRAEEYLPKTTDPDKSLIAAANFVAHCNDAAMRARLRDVFEAFAHDPRTARAILVRALIDRNCALATLAAQLAATSKETFDPPALVDAAILALPDAPLGDLQFCEAALSALRLDPPATCNRMVPHLKDTVAARRHAALRVLKATGLVGAEIRPIVESLLDDSDDAIRYAAADVLGRTDILARAAIPGLLVELGDDDPAVRAGAAQRLDALGIEPREITAALVRATQERNMPVRHGLVLAMKRAYASRQNSLEVLRRLAGDDQDPTTRAYCRAALRELERTDR
jgi:HEAT repeat protein